MTEPFGGVIGRYHEESTPWWPRAARAPDGRAQRAARRARRRRLRAARLLRLRHRHAGPRRPRGARPALHELPHHRAVLADPRLPADRAQPPLERHGPHHRAGHRLPRLRRPHPAARTASSPRCSSPHGYAAWAVGKWHLTPEDECHLAAPRARWPLGRGFERFYGFFGGETHQFAPALVARQPPRRAAALDRRRLPPHRGPRRPRDRVRARPARGRRRQAVLPLLLPPAPATRRTRRRAEWIERYRGRFDRGWDVWREETLARQIAIGPAARRHRALAAARLGAGVGLALAPTSAASTRATWRPSPASSRTPTTSSAGCSTSSTRPASSTTRS